MRQWPRLRQPTVSVGCPVTDEQPIGSQTGPVGDADDVTEHLDVNRLIQNEADRIYQLTGDENVLLLAQQGFLTNDYDAVANYMVLDFFRPVINHAVTLIEDDADAREMVEWLVIAISKVYAAHDYARDQREDDDGEAAA